MQYASIQTLVSMFSCFYGTNNCQDGPQRKKKFPSVAKLNCSPLVQKRFYMKVSNACDTNANPFQILQPSYCNEVTSLTRSVHFSNELKNFVALFENVLHVLKSTKALITKETNRVSSKNFFFIIQEYKQLERYNLLTIVQ